ncbi:hypothetical protein V2J09_008750 [Rumex salicifolius]
MLGSFDSSSFVFLNKLITRLQTFHPGNARISCYFLAAVCCTVLITIGTSYSPTSPVKKNTLGKCNLFDGKWVPDEFSPLYYASDCPFAERGFNCLANGRKDKEYQKWRWKPRNCEIPRLNVRVLLDYLRGKRIVFVGDSMSRTQWESFICILMTGIEDKKSVYEVNGNKITKEIRYLAVRFSSYNFTVEFYRSVFLVLPGPAPRRAPKRVKSVLNLDKLDDIRQKWVDSDVLVFNTGHWWTKTKLFDLGVYFQIGGSLKLGMPIKTALKHALRTWSTWVESSINPKRTRVFFRTLETSHWSARNRVCKVSRRPMSRTKGMERSPFSDIMVKVLKNMTVATRALHVTPMTAYRSDAHVGMWNDNPSVPDCAHWCLPGVPDMWNEILFSYLIQKDGMYV